MTEQEQQLRQQDLQQQQQQEQPADQYSQAALKLLKQQLKTSNVQLKQASSQLQEQKDQVMQLKREVKEQKGQADQAQARAASVQRAHDRVEQQLALAQTELRQLGSDVSTKVRQLPFATPAALLLTSAIPLDANVGDEPTNSNCTCSEILFYSCDLWRICAAPFCSVADEHCCCPWQLP